MRRLALLLALVIAGSCLADLKISGPVSMPAGNLVILGFDLGDKKLTADSSVRWKVRGTTIDPKTKKLVKASLYEDKAKGKLIFVGPEGVYQVEVSVVDFTAKFLEAGETEVVIGAAPAPGPTPDPGPGPGPDPGPTPTGALRVLVVYEAAELPKMTPSQRNLIFGTKVRGALKDRTDKAGPDGRGWNIWDKDTDVSQMKSKFWKDAMARPRPSVPYVHMWRGDTIAFEGPMPADPDAMVELITKNAGN